MEQSHKSYTSDPYYYKEQESYESNKHEVSNYPSGSYSQEKKMKYPSYNDYPDYNNHGY